MSDTTPSTPTEDGEATGPRSWLEAEVDGRPVRSWVDDGQARELRSADGVTAAADTGELTLDKTDVVVNVPFLTWLDGER